MREISQRDILKICYLYYQDERTQAEIARLFGVSRFKISRVIKAARDSGIVSITINDPRGDLTELEIQIAKKFDIEQAIVVKISEFNNQSVLDQVGEAGASYLKRIVGRHRILGVSWGYSVYHVVNNLEPVDATDLTLVQIGGGLGTIEGSDNNMLTMMLGQKLSAHAQIIPAPVIVRNRSIRDTLFKEKKIRETLDIAKKADLVLFGVGMIGMDGLLWRSGFLSHADAVKLKKAKAVGAICGRFFDAQGQKCWDALDDRTIGLTLDELRLIRHKICIAAGKEKVPGILGALKGRLVNILVTDHQTAETLLLH